MGNNIRIGKDFNVQWAINKVVDGERLPYGLVGKELQLYIVNDNGRKEVAGWKVQGNVIEWKYLGKDQRRLGAYQLVLVENAGKEGMVTVDTCKAFNLVEHSCDENVDGGSDIVIKTVTLESDVALAPVVKEVGGGGSYDDTELREAIADLQEENERLKERIEEQDQFIEDLQNTKIEKENDDYYPKMAVGLADNLAGVDVVDSQINFRRSGGGAISDGVARIESIKGNSVVWNNLVQKRASSSSAAGITATWEDDKIHLQGVYDAVGDKNIYSMLKPFQTLDGHSYAVIASGAKFCSIYAFGSLPATNDARFIVKATSGNAEITLRVDKFASAGQAIDEYVAVIITDLTKMFGSGNEPTTIEEFYQRIPMGVDLNAYNEGEVIHMDVQSIESQGVNAWDEEWEVGTIFTSTGENNDYAQDSIRSKNFIPIIGGATYYAESSKVMWGFFYDKDKQPIAQNVTSTIDGLASSLGRATWVAPTNARYMRFYLLSSYGVTYNHDICINISDASINGKYFPYIKRVEDLAVIRKYFPQGMKSAGSAHDEIRYNKASGKWEKVVRIGEVNLGDVDLSYSTSSAVFNFLLSDIKQPDTYAERSQGAICSRYVMQGASLATMPDKSLMRFSGGLIYIKDSAYTDVATFKSEMAGVMLYYELAEPIVTELDEVDQFKDLDYQVWNAGTEKAIAEGKSAPLAADITYGFNAIGKIKELESLVAALRAKVGI